SVPETSGQRLISGARRATCYPKQLDLIECIGIAVAGQRRRRTRTKHVRTRQRKRCDVRPVSKLRLCRKIRWSGLVVGGTRAERVRKRRRARAIVRSKREQASGHHLPDADTFGLVGSVGDVC